MKFEHITKDEIVSMERISRLKLINSVSGFKSANLIGTRDLSGNDNLAIFSSVLHIGTDPALLGFIMRPHTVARHTYEGILETGFYTINQIHGGIIDNAHYTALNFERGESEFEACGLVPQFLQDFAAPYVKESRLKIGLSLVEDLAISSNGTRLIVGLIEHLYFEGDPQREDGSIDLQTLDTVCISGLDHYHRVEPGRKMRYPRRSEKPDFQVVDKRPDGVAYDEKTGTYNAGLLPYASSVGGPSFGASDLTVWKNTSAGKVSAHFKTRFEEIKKEYRTMVEQFSWNEIVYTAEFKFEPVVGQDYHLYERVNGTRFMSLIPPESWKKNCLGTFHLNTDRMWMKMVSEEN